MAISERNAGYSRDKIHFHNFLTGMRTGRNVTLEQLSLGPCSAVVIFRFYCFCG